VVVGRGGIADLRQGYLILPRSAKVSITDGQHREEASPGLSMRCRPKIGMNWPGRRLQSSSPTKKTSIKSTRISPMPRRRKCYHRACWRCSIPATLRTA